MTSRIDPGLARATIAAHRDDRYGPYLHAAETARLIRSALKLAHPGVPFSVRSNSYSGGSSVRVAWTDGPARKAVEATLSGFVGEHFDGMIDMAYSSDCYISPDGRVGFAHTGGTAGSMGSVSARDGDVPAGALIVSFLSYISTVREYSDDRRADPALSAGDFTVYRGAWARLEATSLPVAPTPKY